MKFSHVALSVSDMRRSRIFYENVFGLSVRAEARSEEANAAFLQLENESGVFVELFQHDRPESSAHHALDMSHTGIRHISFEVADIPTVLHAALQAGATLVRDIRSGSTIKRNAFIADPDGIGIELVEI